MPEIGVRELKTRASEIIREVRDKGARYIITYRGQPVGVLIPLEMVKPEDLALRSSRAVWNELRRLGDEISRAWRSPLTSTEILSEMRR